MSIFSNNITPSAPSNRSWNNIGYEEWINVLNNNHRRVWDPSNMRFSDPSEYYYVPADLYKSKNQLKEYLKNRKKELGFFEDYELIKNFDIYTHNDTDGYIPSDTNTYIIVKYTFHDRVAPEVVIVSVD